MVRSDRPDLRIGFFLHIPLPAPEIFAYLPCRDEVLAGLLGADLVGFQRPLAADNFVRLVRQRLNLPTDGNSISLDGRKITVGSFPISVDVDRIEQMVDSPQVRNRAREIRAEFGNPGKLLLGLERLDYTKGIEQRLAAYAEILKSGDA